jgi:hypothetical protein
VIPSRRASRAWVGPAVVGATLALGQVAIAAPHAAREAHVVPTSAAQTGFGAFHEGTGNDRRALRRAFGRATSTNRHGNDTCTIRWRRLGIRVTLVTFGLRKKPCRRGSFLEARLTKRRWHTPAGIRRGSSRAAARRASVGRCRPGRCAAPGYTLGRHPSDCAGRRVPSVIAEIHRARSRVSALVVLTHSCE